MRSNLRTQVGQQKAIVLPRQSAVTDPSAPSASTIGQTVFTAFSPGRLPPAGAGWQFSSGSAATAVEPLDWHPEGTAAARARRRIEPPVTTWVRFMSTMLAACEDGSAATLRAVSRLPVIGLVGGIGSGKSLVASHLRQLGCLVCDSDAMARDILRERRVRDQLIEWWGSGIVDRDGEIDRGRVASIVFARPQERARLESLIHPLVEARRERLFGEPPPGTRALVIDAPLLLEAGLGEKCDAIFFVDAPRPVRLARVVATRGWTEEEVDRREAAQWPLDRKRQAADTVLRNDDEPASLRQEVARALEQVLAGTGRVR